MVVGWWRTMMSPSNSQHDLGLSLGLTMTIPFRIWLLLIFLRANEAVWPDLTSVTGIRFRWMDLTAMGLKWPKGSGPNNRVSFIRIVPWQKKHHKIFQWNFENTTVLFVLNKSWWTVGSEGTMLTGGSIRVQRHPSQGSVRRGKFYSLTVTSHRVEFAPTYRDLGRVSLDSYWPNR